MKFFILFLTATLFAAEPSYHRLQTKPHSLEKETLLGDWNGSREDLKEGGWTFLGSYTTDMISNVIGGVDQGFSYAGSLGLAVHLDGEKAFGWNGGEAFTSFVIRHGTSLSEEKIGNKFPVQQVYGSQTFKLNELYLKQGFCDEKVHVKVGRLNAGNDFLQSPLYYHFVNNAFDGNPISVFFNSVFSAYPNATWGAYSEALVDPHFLVQAGVYNANDRISKNKYHGFNFTFESTHGVIWTSQLSYILNPKSDYEGHYRAGFFYQTGQIDRFIGERVDGNPSLYFLVDQTVYQVDQKRKITPFAVLILAKEDRNLFPWFFSTGAVFQGPFQQRPDDSASFGLAYGKYSSKLNQRHKNEGKAEQSFEMVLEGNYWFQINDYCSIVPDLQYIIRPKGYNTPNAFCMGLQVSFTL